MRESRGNVKETVSLLEEVKGKQRVSPGVQNMVSEAVFFLILNFSKSGSWPLEEHEQQPDFPITSMWGKISDQRDEMTVPLIFTLKLFLFVKI